jgi:rod shape-determining protein MreC
VITGTGPVGRINKVFGDYADVTLISDPSSKVEVVIPRTGGRGILTGVGRSDSYACTIEWLERQGSSPSPAETRLQVGDEVVTSGLGASFPPGLVIGKVTSIGKDDGMFQKVEVSPAVDVSRVRAVEVLLAPPPPPDPDANQKRRSEHAFGGRVL